MHPKVEQITQRIIDRSRVSRAAYLERMQTQAQNYPAVKGFSCGNLAHTVAAIEPEDRGSILKSSAPNLAIVSAYNDMLSAHKPYEDYPRQIRDYARYKGATAQVAGMAPAMCDGVTQGQVGMHLSLFSRDVIAMTTAVSLSHNAYQGVVCLGICDKIVPGLLIGALSYGHLPTVFLPAGPMSTGQSNKDKARTRQAYARGNASYDDLLESECRSYHGEGTCTFYGTANSNQMLLEIMGLQLPSSSFVHPYSKERQSFNAKGIDVLLNSIEQPEDRYSLANIVDPRCIVNALIGLLATGGSTNHAIHLIAIAKAAGVLIDWQDLSELSSVIPLLCRIYPNGSEDVNAFHEAGGMAFVMYELSHAGMLHQDVKTILGQGLDSYQRKAEYETSNQITTSGTWQQAAKVSWTTEASQSADDSILRPVAQAFAEKGGLTLVKGNIGRAISKISAVAEKHQVLTAPARVFRHQSEFMSAFKAGDLDRDFIAVLRFQGPKSCGMPELHQLTPALGVLLDKGFHVALVTDGRMSGASGKVPAAIHLVPEAIEGGPIAKIQDGDLIRLDCQKGDLELLVNEQELNRRKPVQDHDESLSLMGQGLFSAFRTTISNAEQGATVFNYD